MKLWMIVILIITGFIVGGCSYLFGNGGSPAPIQYGNIQVNSTPVGADIFLDGNPTGYKTPYLLSDKTAGNHQIQLSYYHYQDWHQSIDIPANDTLTIDANLTYAPTQTMILQPDGTEVMDTNIWSALPDQNFEDAVSFIIGHEDVNDNIIRGLLQFDLTSLPGNAVITSAELGLYYWSSGYPLISTTIGVYQVQDSWSEGTVTWKSKPNITPTPEDTRIIPDNPSFSFIFWDISDLAAQWQNSPLTTNNHGILLKDINDSMVTLRKYFYSSDYSVYNKRPKLEIDYYLR